MVNDLAARLGDRTPDETKIEPAALARLVEMVEGGQVAASAAKDVLGELVEKGGEPGALVESLGLGMAGGDELEQIVDRALAEQADAVEKIRAGNDRAIGAVIGAVMKETKGRADGGEVQRMIRRADRRLRRAYPQAERA